MSTPDNRRNFLTDLIGRSSEFAHFSSLAAIIVEFEEEELIVSEEDLTLDDGWGEAPTAVAAIEEEPAPASSRDDNWAHHWIMMMARSISLQHFDSLMLIVFECKRVYQFTEKVHQRGKKERLTIDQLTLF